MKVIAQIIGTHGIKGELKTIPLFDDIDILESIEELLINNSKYAIESFRPHQEFILIKLKEINSIDQASQVSGYIQAEIEEELKDNEFYIEDLKGLEVLNQGLSIGRISNISQSGQTLLVIELNENFRPKRELLLPFVEEYIKKISIADSQIEVDVSEEILNLAS